MSLEARLAPLLVSLFASPRHVALVLSRAIIAGALVLVLAAAAHAGRYHAYSCRTPSGGSAPSDGWSGSTSGDPFAYAEDTCATGGALVAALPAQAVERLANAQLPTWALTIPGPETLVGATLYRAGDTAGGTGMYGTYEFWFAGSSQSSLFDECIASLSCAGRGNIAQPLAPENRLVVPSTNLGPHLYMTTSCAGDTGYNCPVGVGDEHGYAAVAYLYAADLLLEQSEGPSVSDATGQLATEGPLHGTSDLIFGATDPGAGVYQAIFNVDGHVVQETVIDENSGRCRNVGQTSDGLPAFLYLQPCRKSLTADVGFDTTAVSNGTHHLTVRVSDAAGNTATVLDRKIGNALGEGQECPVLSIRWV